VSDGDYGCILARWPLDKPLKLAQSGNPRDKCTRATHPILNRLQTTRKPCTFDSRQVSLLLGQWHILKEKNKKNIYGYTEPNMTKKKKGFIIEFCSKGHS